MKISNLYQFIQTHDNFVLTTHENPDGDGLGSMVALKYFLLSLGKQARILVTPSIGGSRDWFSEESVIEVYCPEEHDKFLGQAKCWILVDASDPRRLGALYPVFQSSLAVKACIDHHLKEAPQGFDFEFTDPRASASAQLIFRLIKQEYKGPWKHIAPALYLGIVADTGNFRFSNATPEIHQIASFLIEQGAEPPKTYQYLYHRDSHFKIKLWSRVLQKMDLLYQDRVAIIDVELEDFKMTQSGYEDLDELVQQPMRIPTVEVSVLLIELEEGTTKISLRSREKVDVHKICQMYNGGGHRLAAGAKVQMTIKQLRRDLSETIFSQLN